jgi:thiamine pyrophosphate-dependent acetolactate synthase large subunit-like protein/branched-subunit amino acid aminotransferase/4-amino-4-deoxychorismate lyase
MFSLQTALASLCTSGGKKTIFGVPGAFAIGFLGEIRQTEGLSYYLASHEGGAAFMATGYAQASRGSSCVNKKSQVNLPSFAICASTAGPGALNSLTGLAAARADGASVLYVHGEVPRSLLGRAALQDCSSYGCDIDAMVKNVVGRQVLVNDEADAADAPVRVAEALAHEGVRPRRAAPVHVRVPMNLFAAPTTADTSPSVDDSVAAQVPPDVVARVLAALRSSERLAVFVGHGVAEAGVQEELDELLRATGVPVLVSARASACVDHTLPGFAGQYSIFPHPSAVAFLKSGAPTTLLVLGSSLGEFATNSWSSDFASVRTVVHLDVDAATVSADQPRLPSVTETVGSDAGLAAWFTSHATELTEALKDAAAAFVRVDPAVERLDRAAEVRRDADSLYAEDATLTGSRVVHALGRFLTESLPTLLYPRVNVVADTGSAKLYAAHYIGYNDVGRFRLLMPGGTIDSMGYGLCAAVGAAVAAVDSGEGERTLTVALIGDGALHMNNEFNALVSNAATRSGTSMLIVVLNDASLSYVYQGFTAVLSEPLAETSFSTQVDVAAAAAAYGLDSVVVEDMSMLNDPAFLQSLVDRRCPVVLDCRVARDVVGPGYERYNTVRRSLGKEELTVSAMNERLRDAGVPLPPAGSAGRRDAAAPGDHGHVPTRQVGRRCFSSSTGPTAADDVYEAPRGRLARECFAGPADGNTVHLYGVIQEVFLGNLTPDALHCVAPDLKFGVGVSAFAGDRTNVGDAVFANGRFFVRNTDAGVEAAGGAGFREGRATDYRTGYSLGITTPYRDLVAPTYVVREADDPTPAPSMRQLIESFIGPARDTSDPDDAGRIVGYIGLVEYETFLGTSLQVSPSTGENILEVIDEFARPSIPVPRQLGVVCGFARTSTNSNDSRAAESLYHRMFYDNPRDNDGAYVDEADAAANLDGGTHWISHTHGIRFDPAANGTSLFDRTSLSDATTDETVRNLLVEETLSRSDVVDCGHVIPSSTIRRGFFTLFPCTRVRVHAPAPIGSFGATPRPACMPPRRSFSTVPGPAFGSAFVDQSVVLDLPAVSASDARVVPTADLSFPATAVGLHYGAAVFEGVKAFRNEVSGHVAIFRPDAHAARLRRSAASVCLPDPVVGEHGTVDEFVAATLIPFVRANADAVPTARDSPADLGARALYVRPLLTASTSTLDIRPAPNARLVVVGAPVPPYGGTGSMKLAVAHHGNAPSLLTAKVAGNYAQAARDAAAATDRGLDQALHVYGEAEAIGEVGTMNFFLVRRNRRTGERVLMTPAIDSGLLLAGVTRDSILALARGEQDASLGADSPSTLISKVVEGPLTMGDIQRFAKDGELDEMFGTGTAVGVAPVSSIVLDDGTSYDAAHEHGPVATALLDALLSIQVGKVGAAGHEWMVKV